MTANPYAKCIKITKFSPDGTLSGPANDHFSGDYLGIWTQTGYHSISATLVQNNTNPDGTAGGLYIVNFTMTIGTSDQASGTGTIQLLNNAGAVQFSGTYSFKGTRLRLPYRRFGLLTGQLNDWS